MRRCVIRCLKGIRGMGLTSELMIHEGRANYRHDSARVFWERKDNMRWAMCLAYAQGTSGRAGWQERRGQAGRWCGEFKKCGSRVVQDLVGCGFSSELI